MEAYGQTEVTKWVGILHKHKDQGINKKGKGFSETS